MKEGLTALVLLALGAAAIGFTLYNYGTVLL